ncbi:MAG: hypothetical protein H0U64_02245 [Gemmatimonadaceae bacterium]|nr:hypothetical protein [Gemmatimonadaceae bacterium]
MNTTQAHPAKNAETATERFNALKTRFAEVGRMIAAGELSEELLIEETDLRGRVLAAERVRDAADQRAHKAKIAAMVKNFDAEADKLMTKVGGLIPQLIFVLSDLEALVTEGLESGAGNGRSLQDILGVPQNFATDVKNAILQAAPRAQWNYDVCAGDKAQRPNATPERFIGIPMAAGSPPPGYSGAWDYRTGPVNN